MHSAAPLVVHASERVQRLQQMLMVHVAWQALESDVTGTEILQNRLNAERCSSGHLTCK